MSYIIEVLRGRSWQYRGGPWATQRNACHFLVHEVACCPGLKFRVVPDAETRKANKKKRIATAEKAVVKAVMASFHHGYVTNTCSDLHAACVALDAAKEGRQ